MNRKDERNILFARASYKKGTPMHEEYYKRNPQKLEFDEKLRERSVMGDEKSALYNPLISPIPFSVFDFLADIKPFSVGDVNPNKTNATSEEFTTILKGLATYYGAKYVSIIKLCENDYYSHRARPAEEYSKIIEPIYKYGIAFACEMDEKIIDTAPNITQSLATTKGYVDTAIIGMVLSYYIRGLGYEARNNMDGNYIFPLVSLFDRTNIGDIGINGLLISKKFGPRMRLGLVSTNIPVIEDEKQDLYIKEFCKLCQRCKASCPPKAIDDNLENFRDEMCISMWQHLGSDCGICISICPFSHNLPSELTSDLSTSESREKLKIYCDERFPQRKPMLKKYPEWAAIAYENQN